MTLSRGVPTAIPHGRQVAAFGNQPITAQAFQSGPVTHSQRKFRPSQLNSKDPLCLLSLRKSVVSFFHLHLLYCLIGSSEVVGYNGCSQKNQDQASHKVCQYGTDLVFPVPMQMRCVVCANFLPETTTRSSGISTRPVTLRSSRRPRMPRICLV
jgi:hypothetical protein